MFHISAQNTDCGYWLEPHWRGGSNEYQLSMFLSRNKNNVYPCKPEFYYIKVGFKWQHITETLARKDSTSWKRNRIFIKKNVDKNLFADL